MHSVINTEQPVKAIKLIGGLEYFALFFALLMAAAGLLFKPLFALAGMLILLLALRKPIFAAYYVVLFHWSELIPVIGARIEAFKMAAGPVNITVNDLLFALISLILLLSLFRHPARIQRFLSTPLGKATALFVIYQLFHVAYSLYLGVALDSVIRETYKYLVAVYAIYFYIYFNRYDVKKFLKFCLLLVMVLPVFQVYMMATGEVWKTSSGTDRTYYIGVNIFYIGVIVFYMMQKKFNAMTIVIIFYMMAGMAMTQYRSAFIALLAVLPLGGIYLMRDGKVNRVVLGTLGMAMVAITGVVVLSFVRPDFIDQTIKRYSDTFNTEDRNVINRQYMWRVSWEAFKNQPLLGVGAARSIYSYVDDDTYLSEMQWSPHNFIMRIAAKEGFIGVLSIMAIIYLSYRRISKLRMSQVIAENDRRSLMLFLVALIIIQLMNTTFTSAKSNFIFWFLVGYIQILVYESTVNIQADKRSLES